MSKETGGSAFGEYPLTFIDDNGVQKMTGYKSGMTLRDYFAGQALAGLLAHPQVLTHETCANIAYKAADAMLAERSKT